MAEDFRKGESPETRSPWAYRIGVPFLASLAPSKDMMQNFLTVNIIANALISMLLVIWLRLYIVNWKVRMLLILMFLLSWHSMPRRVFYAPVMIDHWDKVWLLAGMIGIHKIKSWRLGPAIALLSLVSAVGVFFRETMMLIPVAVLFASNPIQFIRNDFVFKIKSWPRKVFYVPLVFSIAAFISVRLMVTPEAVNFFPLRDAARGVYEMLLSQYVLGWFIAYGPILVLVLYNWRNSMKYLMEHQFQLFLLAGVVLLSWIGGVTVYRFSYWAFPILFVLIGKAIEERTQELKSPLFVGILLISQIVSQRVFMLIPDYPSSAPSRFPIFTPLGNDVPLLDVIGIGDVEVCFFALLEYLLFSACVLLYLHYRRGRYKKLQSAI